VNRRQAHWYPAWFDRPADRLRLVAELQTVATKVTVVRPTGPRRGGFAIRVILTPLGLGSQRVMIEFNANSPEVPHVFVFGPGSPHRYDDGSLCIWHPHDRPEQRWTWHNGGVALAGYICAHLIREAWWRQTDEWVGEEAPHLPPLQPPRRPNPRAHRKGAHGCSADRDPPRPPTTRRPNVAGAPESLRWAERGPHRTGQHRRTAVGRDKRAMRNDGVSAKILYVGISPELDIGEPIDEWTSLRQCTQYVSNCIEFQPECKTVSNSWLFSLPALDCRHAKDGRSRQAVDQRASSCTEPFRATR
jgi:hypothetical protein